MSRLHDKKTFPLTYTIFEVSDGNSFSKRFQKYYHRILHLISFSMIYNTPPLLKTFSLTYQVSG